MSTQYWRLPTARLEGASSSRCLQRLAAALYGLLVAYFLLIATASTAIGPALALLLLAGVALGCALRQYHRHSRTLALVFHNGRWSSADGKPLTFQSSYLSAVLLAVTVVVGEQRHRLLLTRDQLSQERWRRLRLALSQRHELQPAWPAGASTVSPASGSSSG